MRRDVIEKALTGFKGCTFATLDTQTEAKGIRTVSEGVNVMLFTNKSGSAYERLVKRRLRDAGRNPDNFVVGDLAWGSRVDGTPLIEHKDKVYLQAVIISPGTKRSFIGTYEIPTVEPKRTNQGLSREDEVLVRAYSLDSITRLALLGEEYGNPPVLVAAYKQV